MGKSFTTKHYYFRWVAWVRLQIFGAQYLHGKSSICLTLRLTVEVIGIMLTATAAVRLSDGIGGMRLIVVLLLMLMRTLGFVFGMVLLR